MLMHVVFAAFIDNKFVALRPALRRTPSMTLHPLLARLLLLAAARTSLAGRLPLKADPITSEVVDYLFVLQMERVEHGTKLRISDMIPHFARRVYTAFEMKRVLANGVFC